jgi:hypothetical protein
MSWEVVAVPVLLVVLIVWSLVACWALVLARTLCAAAARADADDAQRAGRPAGAPQGPAATSRDVTTLRLVG